MVTCKLTYTSLLLHYYTSIYNLLQYYKLQMLKHREDRVSMTTATLMINHYSHLHSFWYIRKLLFYSWCSWHIMHASGWGFSFGTITQTFATSLLRHALSVFTSYLLLEPCISLHVQSNLSIEVRSRVSAMHMDGVISTWALFYILTHVHPCNWLLIDTIISLQTSVL